MKPLTLKDLKGTPVEMLRSQLGLHTVVKYGLAKLKRHVGMNQTEKAYSAWLESEKTANRIAQWDFEPEKLKLAIGTYYTPDFRIINMDGTIEFHETKGFWTDDARVKIKVASHLHPYVFKSVLKRSKKVGGGWLHTVIR